MKAMKNITVFILLTLVFLWVGKVSYAAYLKFDKTTVSNAANQTFTLDVTVDAGTDQVT